MFSALCPGSNDVNPVSEEVLNSVDGEVKTSYTVHSTDGEVEE
jgi:hypothetical protein